jgi:outer membrane biosynthesis protein TonB
LSGGEIPLYPAAALSAHLTGVVEIEVTVEDGNVTNATVKRGEHDPPLVET